MTMKKVINFLKKETVLCIAALLALISMYIVPPDADYISYIDFRVLALLYCLMLVVAGMQNIGVFSHMGGKLLNLAGNTRLLALLLILICFFSSMLITNDVALITFVPFAVMLLTMTEKHSLLIPVIVLQTIAANLGSMLTPIGNPQNLYLYSSFNISFGDFLLHMLPLTIASGILLIASVFFIKKEPVFLPSSQESGSAISPAYLAIYGLLFLVCLFCVLHILPYQAMLVIVILIILAADRNLFAKADYFLLLTFVCFFVFIGNMERIPAVSGLLNRLISGRELTLGILLSQFISNVPAAILLSGFTSDFAPLLYGVNIGGLGTLIASLASVISYRCYSAAKHAEKGKYMMVFTAYNIIFLIILTTLAFLLTAA